MIRNVVTVCDGAGITGGTEKVAITSALELANRGLQGIFFCGEGEVAPGLANAIGVKVHSLGLKDAYNTQSKAELLRRFFWNRDAGLQFSQVLRDSGFEPSETIIHVHGFRRVLSGSVVKAAKQLGFKVIFTLHDFGIACPNTSFFEHKTESICTRKPLSLGCYSCQCTHSGWPMKLMQMGRAANLAMKRVAEDFDHFIYVSEFSRKILEPLIPTRPSTTLYNPVSGEVETQASPGEFDTFTYVGRLSPEKGVRTFAKAAAVAGVKCRFVGSGPEADAIRLANPDAELVGWVTPDEVDCLIRSSRALVMPSLWYETAGLSVIEAVSRGIPALVSNRCASVEYVKHEQSGIVYEGASLESLATAMGNLTAERAAELGKRAYQEYWQAPLTVEKYVTGLLEVYERTLSS
jgi:glycosyltransferase involved in cell wall biosynthesis